MPEDPLKQLEEKFDDANNPPWHLMGDSTLGRIAKKIMNQYGYGKRTIVLAAISALHMFLSLTLKEGATSSIWEVTGLEYAGKQMGDYRITVQRMNKDGKPYEGPDWKPQTPIRG